MFSSSFYLKTSVSFFLYIIIIIIILLIIKMIKVKIKIYEVVAWSKCVTVSDVFV
jgi:hypothetical protein